MHLPELLADIEYDPETTKERVAELWSQLVETDLRASTDTAFARRDTLIEVFCLITGESSRVVLDLLEERRKAERECERWAEEIEEARQAAAQAAHDEMVADGEPVWAEAG